MNKDLILREKLAVQRTVMANQTTYLAFVRTALYFTVAGLSIKNLLQISHGEILQYVLYGIAAALFTFGTVNFFIQQKMIKKSEIHIGDYKTEYLNK